MRLVLAASAVVLVAAANDARACSCSRSPDPATAYAKYDAVFRGTVTSIEGGISGGGVTADLWFRAREVLGMEPSFDDYDRQVHLAVSESWKGVATTTVTIRTGSGGGDCGFGFNVGADYIVYAYATEAGLRTGICSRTHERSSAPEDIAFLATQPRLALSASAPGTRLLAPVAAVFAVTASALLFVFLRRRRARSARS